MEKKQSLAAVITASSVGTLIEWYDFYIFGSLATIIATKFFPSGNPTLALLSTLATFAAGFVARPFGALVFGRLGDVVGRKYTFLLTLVIMGLSTFLIGCIPSYESIGVAAPILVLILRLLQGLALGGEYGGAATYVAEHSPAHRRGLYTSWIQTTATVGLFISLLVIIMVKATMSESSFNEYGWRIPFWLSLFMVGISILIRLRMQESPLFAKAKAEGKTVSNPLKESFGKRYNFKFVLLALFGATMGQGVVWYTGQFYALSFIQNTLSVEVGQASRIMMWALLFGTPLFILCGWLSDIIGRKWIMLLGMLLAIVCYRPIYKAMYHAGSLQTAQQLSTDKQIIHEPGGALIKRQVVHYNDGSQLVTETKQDALLKKEVKLGKGTYWKLVLLVFVQVVFVAMVYGPIAAFLVEMFPTAIRYTSMSFPYHIGNGIFGGLLPAIATFLATRATQVNNQAIASGGHAVYEYPHLEGLWYPIIIATVCFIIGSLYISDKQKTHSHAE